MALKILQTCLSLQIVSDAEKPGTVEQFTIKKCFMICLTVSQGFII